ncbi:MAG: hypothetical protein M3R25_06435 [Bacteroidota bacterium]|nr:hypothetical protein [Bacteroidota bacterium]
MNKNDILRRIEHTLRNNIHELTSALNDYEAGANLDEGDTMDPEDYSQQSEQRDLKMQMQIQLDQANNQLSKLQGFANKVSSIVEPGALVNTDKNIFFIGLSLSAQPIDGFDLYCISTDSPAYNAMRGKSEGDHFDIGKETHKITSVK